MRPGAKALALAGAVLGLLGVVLAALGSHAVPGMEEPQTWRSWQAASLMQLVHAAALMALAALAGQSANRLVSWGGWLIVTGVILFSGSIYLSVMLGLHDTANLAPAGGLTLMAGWLAVIAGISRS